jgi:hypothetical protein
MYDLVMEIFGHQGFGCPIRFSVGIILTGIFLILFVIGYDKSNKKSASKVD